MAKDILVIQMQVDMLTHYNNGSNKILNLN
jgi:hypothetical protein